MKKTNHRCSDSYAMFLPCKTWPCHNELRSAEMQ